MSGDSIDLTVAIAAFKTAWEEANLLPGQVGHRTEAGMAAAAPLIVQQAKAQALREAAARWQTGDWFDALHGFFRQWPVPTRMGASQAVLEWLNDRADQIEAP